MSVTEWEAAIAIMLAVIGVFGAMLKFYVKAILREFVPNGGNSMRDKINALEARQKQILALMQDEDAA